MSSGRGKINDFVVQKRLGKGAYGQVFKVLRKSDGQVYALKKVSIASMSEREVRDALQEIRFLASIRHPNIIGFLEAFIIETSMELCIVQEFADGGDLAAKLEGLEKAKKLLDENVVWSYFIQITEALSHLHSKKILHRDIKPANCFLTLDGRVKLGDLNVSRLVKQDLVRTQIGTPYYMSPEIWRNRPYDDKSDMWSLGCVLYELCALRPPFRGRDVEDLSRRVQTGYYPRIPSTYSRDLDQLIASLLQLEPKRRPSADRVLESPVVARKREELSRWMDSTLKMQLAEADGERDLLSTIAVPRNARRNLAKLSDALPSPQYERPLPFDTSDDDEDEDGGGDEGARAAARAGAGGVGRYGDPARDRVGGAAAGGGRAGGADGAALAAFGGGVRGAVVGAGFGPSAREPSASSARVPSTAASAAAAAAAGVGAGAIPASYGAGAGRGLAAASPSSAAFGRADPDRRIGPAHSVASLSDPPSAYDLASDPSRRYFSPIKPPSMPGPAPLGPASIYASAASLAAGPTGADPSPMRTPAGRAFAGGGAAAPPHLHGAGAGVDRGGYGVHPASTPSVVSAVPRAPAAPSSSSSSSSSDPIMDGLAGWRAHAGPRPAAAAPTPSIASARAGAAYGYGGYGGYGDGVGGGVRGRAAAASPAVVPAAAPASHGYLVPATPRSLVRDGALGSYARPGPGPDVLDAYVPVTGARRRDAPEPSRAAAYDVREREPATRPAVVAPRDGRYAGGGYGAGIERSFSVDALDRRPSWGGVGVASDAGSARGVGRGDVRADARRPSGVGGGRGPPASEYKPPSRGRWWDQDIEDRSGEAGVPRGARGEARGGGAGGGARWDDGVGRRLLPGLEALDTPGPERRGGVDGGREDRYREAAGFGGVGNGAAYGYRAPAPSVMAGAGAAAAYGSRDSGWGNYGRGAPAPASYATPASYAPPASYATPAASAARQRPLWWG